MGRTACSGAGRATRNGRSARAVAQAVHGGTNHEPAATLDELGLTSLDRIEFLTALQENAAAVVSESAIAGTRTVADLRRAITSAPATTIGAAIRFPSWNRTRAARLVRDASHPSWLLPLARPFMQMEVSGREHLAATSGPLILASNHQSHFDTPAILAALAPRWRRSLSVAMAKEFFDPHFLRAGYPVGERLVNDVLYGLAALFFNAFPLPRTEPGAGQALRYVGELIDEGWSVLIFPEGHRTEHGDISRFAPGVGLLAARLRVPVVPIRLSGAHHVLHHSAHWPTRARVGVTFGSPMMLEGADYAALAAQVERAVRMLSTPVSNDSVEVAIAAARSEFRRRRKSSSSNR